MVTRPVILASAQSQFPASANRTVRVRAAWRAEDDETGATQPAPNGPHGWTGVSQPATAQVLRGLQSRGFTWVNLEAGGTARPFRDVPISSLL
ncbi:hypothetical protein [Cellulomonas sp. GbtcB1]|uniref:hypothetical protein n=1 Tax=Cellulomonas sp. GbtcB1 TaxID=2824746 RepID=UPI001C2F7F1E|nr:hypothetical protein [Cellulomonas sp. GbtcB1]